MKGEKQKGEKMRFDYLIILNLSILRINYFCKLGCYSNNYLLFLNNSRSVFIIMRIKLKNII